MRTPGPWAADPDDRPDMEWNIHIVSADDPDLRIAFMANGPRSEANAAFIVEACNNYESLQARCTELEADNEELRALRYEDGLFATRATEQIRDLQARCDRYKAALGRLVGDLDGLISQSDGVSGLHLNGDIAQWDELLYGGTYETWLMSLEVARKALEDTK